MKLSYRNTRNGILFVATLLLTGIYGCKAADEPNSDSQLLADSGGDAAESSEMDISKYKVGDEIAVYTRGYALREEISHIDGDGNLYEGPKYALRKIVTDNIIGYILPKTNGFERQNAVKIRHKKSNFVYQGFVLLVYERGLTIVAANDPRGYEMNRYLNWADIEIEHVLVPQWTPEMLKCFLKKHSGF